MRFYHLEPYIQNTLRRFFNITDKKSFRRVLSKKYGGNLDRMMAACPEFGAKRIAQVRKYIFNESNLSVGDFVCIPNEIVEHPFCLDVIQGEITDIDESIGLVLIWNDLLEKHHLLPIKDLIKFRKE